MKTRIFALLNLLSLLLFTITLEFAEASILSNALMLTGMALFVVSGFQSVFNHQIWKTAHANFESKPKAYFLDLTRLTPASLATFVRVMSSGAEFIPTDRNLVLFISYVVIYISLFTPCHVIIFKHDYLLKST